MTDIARSESDDATAGSGAAGRWLPAALAALALPMLLSLGACSDPLSVEDPDIAQPEDLTGRPGLEAQRLGAFGDFAQAYGGNSTGGGGTQGQILTSGLFADEFIHSGTFPTRIQMDARRIDVQNGTLGEYYHDLHLARRAAESAADAWAAADTLSGSATVSAEMNNLAGYTYLFFAENFCSGVPFSRVNEEGDLEYGDGMTTQEMFQTAISRFDQASSSAGSTDLQNLASVGRARALLNMGQFDQAAQEISGISTDWEYNVEYSTNTDRQVNGTMSLTNLTERWAVANNEGGGIAYREAYENGDPRTPWVVAPDSAGFDTDVVAYYELKYPNRDSPIPLASGIEARLIEAEAALQAGDDEEFEDIHNALRARLDTSAVGPVEPDTMSDEQMVDFHFEERAKWLWLTGHRHGDMRRLIRQYGRTEDEVFPSGEYFKPQFGTYGDQVVLPVPFDETNNPNFSGQTNICVNMDA